jgi:hypothetical protein
MDLKTGDARVSPVLFLPVPSGMLRDSRRLCFRRWRDRSDGLSGGGDAFLLSHFRLAASMRDVADDPQLLSGNDPRTEAGIPRPQLL